MIRRIVDSVSLLTDMNGQQECSELKNMPDSPHHIVSNGLDNHSDDDDRSSSRSSGLDGVKDQQLFTFHRPLTTLSSSGSCYIAPKSIPTLCMSASSDEKTKRSHSPSPVPTRRQSLSPGRVDPSLFAIRPLPGGGPPLHQRPQRTQLVRKKENSKGIGTATKSMKPPRQTKDNESEYILSANDDDESAFTGISCQTDPLVMSVECYVLPFLQDLKAIELRIPAANFSKAQRRILKQLAQEHELLILSMGKVPAEDEVVIVVRKRASLQQKQQIQWEKEQVQAAERARIRAEEEERKRKILERQELIRTNQLHQEISCQANFEDAQPEMSRKKYRRLRRDRRRRANADKRPVKPKLVDGSMQTVPEDHWLCPWCLQHIPPEAQCGHEAICRAGVRLKQKELELKARLDQRNADLEARRRQKLGLPPLKKTGRKQQPGLNPTPSVGSVGQKEAQSGRSRSRTRLVVKTEKSKNKVNRPRSRSASKNDPRNQTSVVTKLDSVHPNDLEAMAKLMRRVCSQPGCDQISDAGDPSTRSAIKCLGCRQSYCDRHRPVGLHTLCPAPEKPIPPTTKPGAVSTACGWDVEEKRAALRSAIRERRAALQERRQRY